MSSSRPNIFNLLPTLYRMRDARLVQSRNLLSPGDTARLQQLLSVSQPLTTEQQAELDQLKTRAARGPLESLLMVIEEQIAAMDNDLDQLYDDQFIETCATWVVPYIGDLIGYQTIYGKAPTIATPRAEVANTISFRRRKGTVLAMEQLAAEATGWGAHAVEFFKLLACTQYMNHLRPHNQYAPDLRRWEPRAFMNSGFDATAHKVDVRRIAIERGRYNIPNIGIFLWSLNAYSITNCPLTAVAKATGSSVCYRFSPLNRDLCLFHRAISQEAEITAPVEPFNVPDQLWRRLLCRDIHKAAGVYYGATGGSLSFTLKNAGVLPSQIQVCDLSGADGSWANAAVASPYLLAVDPILGRVVLPAQSPTPQLRANYHYGFNADMGGGEYARTINASPDVPVITVSGGGNALQNALAALPNSSCFLQITDSSIYQLPATSLNIPAEFTVQLVARPGARPAVILGGALTVNGGSNSAFYINGLLISANFTPARPLINVPAKVNGADNQLSQLSLTHCTLDPLWSVTAAPGAMPAPAITASASGLAVTISLSIVGGLQLDNVGTATISDSIIDATGPTNIAYSASDNINGGGALTLTGCTVIGKVHATLLNLVSDAIFWSALAPGDTWLASLWADRKQQGCVRFSYLPMDPIIPRSYKCQVEGYGVAGPLFSSLHYGDPDYCKLLPGTDDAIRRGADDGGEMGAFHFIFAPLRETDLIIRLREYIPVGMEFGIFYET
jgi:hypothetical protein